MKSTWIKNTLGLLALGLVATGAQAGWERHDHGYGYDHGYDHRAIQQSRQFSQQVDARQERQMERIRVGLQEGRLTRAEFRRLKQEQREIRAMADYFRGDGLIDAREFRRLDRALNEASDDIWAEKHDREARSRYADDYRYN